jgi:hypothetical protein
MPKILRTRDVIQLLHLEVAAAGGQSGWARKTGIHRSLINKVLGGQKPSTKSIINALQLEVVYLPKRREPPSSQAGKPHK